MVPIAVAEVVVVDSSMAGVSVDGVPVVKVSVVDISVSKKLSVVAIVLNSTEDESPADVELNMTSGVDSETASDDSDCDNVVDKEMASSEVDSVESDVVSIIDCTAVLVTSDVVVIVGNVVSDVRSDEGDSDVVPGESDVDAESVVYSVDVVNSEVDREESDDVVVENAVGSSVVDVTGRDATTAISFCKSLIKPLKPSYKAHSCQALLNVTARHARFPTQNVMHSVKLRS